MISDYACVDEQMCMYMSMHVFQHFIFYISLLFLFIFLKICSIVLCWFLPYNNVNQHAHEILDNNFFLFFAWLLSSFLLRSCWAHKMSLQMFLIFLSSRSVLFFLRLVGFFSHQMFRRIHQ